MSSQITSVIVPVFNGENYLEQALYSVLQQSEACQEIIIVDDGSTDRTAEIAQKFCLNPNTRYVRQENAGHAAALNTGVSFVQGDLVAFIDHDDLWLPRKLALQTDLLRNNPTVDLVFTEMQNFADGEGARGLKFSTTQMAGFLPGTMMVRKQVLRVLDSFDESLRKGFFLPWFKRLETRGLTMRVIPELLYKRRIHGGNTAICGQQADYRDYFAAIRKARAEQPV
ncbi:glycosyltransferase family 2 protein [Alphaproteobacteria bacterium]|nr:glycosyltransferase family 2 protein [Alphaproteobacteria bacterium]